MSPIKSVLAIAALATAVTFPSTVLAEPEIWRTTASFSGQRTMTVEGGPTISGAYYHTPKVQRWDMTAQGRMTRIITRRDERKTYMVMPAQRMYMVVDVSKMPLAGERPKGLVRVSRVGTETVNGERTVKYRLVTNNETGSFDGHIWVAEGNIHMKMAGTVKSPRKVSKMTVELTKLKRGGQDPKLFQIPAGFKNVKR